MSPSIGEESDDELSGVPGKPERSRTTPTALEDEPQLPGDSSNVGAGTAQAPSSFPSEKRYSRGPPPPPPTMPAPAHNRPPPPPPPVPATRASTGDSGVSSQAHLHKDDHEEEVTEYDGDYDTDIASGAKHKDALKAHGRDSSLDEGIITDDFNAQSPTSPPQGRPPIPSATAPRAAPPPPPTQPPKQARKSSDMPRAPPPPVPPPKAPSEGTVRGGDDEYDPFRYDAPAPSGRGEPRATVTKPPAEEPQEYDLYSSSPPRRSAPSSAAPPPPPPQSPPLQTPRQSMDMLKGSGSIRKSTDAARPSMDQGYIAGDVDLGENTQWWIQPNTPPPVFQNRRDILVEIEETPASKRSGKRRFLRTSTSFIWTILRL